MKAITTYFCLFKECLIYFFHLCKYNASINTDNDKEKMQYTILRENHVIEKGLSLRNPRTGFGKEKIINLIRKLKKYNNIYNDKQFILYPLATIANYIKSQNSNSDILPINQEFKTLLDELSISESELKIDAGIKNINATDIKSILNSNFETLAKSRHSIRYFSKEKPDDSIINKALEIAQQTPSACNRQSWKIHLFYGDDVANLLKWQGGARGFEQEPTIAILITANSKAFLYYEPFQAYVDGGLYAMNLINAIHSLELGTIPLSCGFNHKKIKLLHKTFNIPQNEIPIIIIGVGCLEENFKIAISTRKPFEQIITKH